MTGPGAPAGGPPALEAVAAALRAAWAADTCDPVDIELWSPATPSRGQCGVTAVVLHELLGGEVLLAEVHHADGSPQGVHFWNRLPGGEEVDLTRGQFTAGELVGVPEVFELPPPERLAQGRLATQHALLRARVRAALGLGAA